MSQTVLCEKPDRAQRMASSGVGPKLHRHPYAETFIVQEGQATFTVGDDRIEARAGDVVVAQANVPRAFVNSGQDELRSVTSTHPGDGDRVALIGRPL